RSSRSRRRCGNRARRRDSGSEPASRKFAGRCARGSGEFRVAAGAAVGESGRADVVRHPERPGMTNWVYSMGLMPLKVRTVEYFYTRIEDASGKAYELLSKLASEDINLLAFSAVPFGSNRVELTIFPDQPGHFVEVAKKLGWTLTGPYHACLIQGDDQLGAL